jgi:hypothetical protein
VYLQIREDTKTGVYVESLTEEYVSTMADVTHLIMRVKPFTTSTFGPYTENVRSETEISGLARNL